MSAIISFESFQRQDSIASRKLVFETGFGSEFVVDEDRCFGCAACVALCPVNALVLEGLLAIVDEFPVLQMLYRQGMLLPNHPNNTGVKPLLI